MQCHEKKKFMTREAAMHRVRRTQSTEYSDKSGRLKRAKEEIQNDVRLSAYLCPICSFYHVGHQRTPYSCYEILRRDSLSGVA